MQPYYDLIFIISTILVRATLQFEILFEGESCRNNDGVSGRCIKSSKCHTAEFAIKVGQRPKICSFEGKEAVICCPPESEFKTTTKQPHNHHQDVKAVAKAKRKCAEYAKSVILEIESPVLTVSTGKETIDRCARVEEPLVLGGEKAKPREYPHMALIGYGDSKNIKWLCGGSLISDKFVISAAHCSIPKGRGPARWVKLGELDNASDQEDSEPQIIKIIRRIDHPQYNADKSLYYDITLFKLEREVFFDAYIRPICLTTSPDLAVHTAIATGWGHTQWGGVPSDSLLKVRLNIVNERKCSTLFKNTTSSKLANGIIASQVCAGDEKGKDTCQGDSGGPLQSPIDDPYCMYELIGVTSFGKGCGLGYPGIYTRISAFLPWIVQNVWPE